MILKVAASDMIVLQRYEEDCISNYMDIDDDAKVDRKKLKVIVLPTSADSLWVHLQVLQENLR